MTYVPKSTKLILEAKQQLQNDVVRHSLHPIKILLHVYLDILRTLR